MNLNPTHIRQFVVILICVTAAAIIASVTIGRDIYYGTTQVSFLSFGIINFSGYLFFLFMPVELAFIYYLHTGLSMVFLNLIAVSTGILSLMIDYYIGRSFSTKFIDLLVGRHRYEKAENRIRQYGNISIFLFNLLPLASPVILLAAGMLKHPMKEALLYSLLGLVAKYLFMTIVFF